GSCTLAPGIFVNDLGIPFTSVLLKPGATGCGAVDGSFTPTDYKAIHFIGYVPALKVTPDGEHMLHRRAILSFGVVQITDSRCASVPDTEQAKIQDWTTWLSGTPHGCGCAMWLHPTRFTAADVPGVNDEVHGIIKETGRRKIFESRLPRDGFAIGGKTTIVDFQVALFYSWDNKILDIGMTRYAKYSEFVRNALK
ncbi:hypothetical protein BD289DRAFT_378380, partial [Coniella lustricola]